MDPVITVPSPIVGWAILVFSVAGLIYKGLDGIKNLVPGLAQNATVMKVLNFVGSFLTIGGACFVVGQVHDAFDVLKCLTAAVMASLVAAGLYEAKKTSDVARAGGAAALANMKAVAEVSNAPIDVPPTPMPKKNGK